MQWQLGPWSPWLSHIAALLIGFAIPHLTNLDYRPEQMPTGYLLLTRSPVANTYAFHGVSTSRRCRYTSTPWRVFQHGGVDAIGTPIPNRRAKSTISQLLAREDLKFEPEWKSRNLEECKVEPKITYSPH